MKRRELLKHGATALACSSLVNSAAYGQTQLGSQQPIEGNAHSADGTRIGYLKVGTGPSLVVVHGALGTGDEWLPVASELAQYFTCYLLAVSMAQIAP